MKKSSESVGTDVSQCTLELAGICGCDVGNMRSDHVVGSRSSSHPEELRLEVGAESFLASIVLVACARAMRSPDAVQSVSEADSGSRGSTDETAVSRRGCAIASALAHPSAQTWPHGRESKVMPPRNLNHRSRCNEINERLAKHGLSPLTDCCHEAYVCVRHSMAREVRPGDGPVGHLLTALPARDRRCRSHQRRARQWWNCLLNREGAGLART